MYTTFAYASTFWLLLGYNIRYIHSITIFFFFFYRDIAKYNTDDDLEESIEETGWKLVHGDVFRPPNNNRLFASIIGSGVQIFCMMGITIFFAMLGMLSPASRGALLTAAIFLYEVQKLSPTDEFIYHHSSKIRGFCQMK